MRKEIFYAISLFLFSVLIVFFLIIPQYQNLETLKKLVADFETARKNQVNYFEELKKISFDLERHKDALSKIETALPSNPSLPELFHFIQGLCAQNECDLIKIGSISTFSLPNSQLKETKTEITVRGNYSNFKKFLSGIERSSRLIEIENISFSFPETGPQKKTSAEEGLFNFNLKIKTYNY